MENCTFGWALNQLKKGIAVFRKGWHLQGMYLELQIPDENSKMTLPYIYLNVPCGAKNDPEQGEITLYDRVPWLASHTDMLSEDWDNMTR